MTKCRSSSLAAAALGVLLVPVSPSAADPVLVGLDLEFGHTSSSSAEAIRRGVVIASEEINARGGVLGGRPLEVVALDNRSVPSRGIANIRTLAARRDLVAVVCGKFSPVVLEEVPILHELGLPLLDPWASADAIVANGHNPNYVFRLSMHDGIVWEAILDHAARRGLTRIGLLLPHTAWGRSNEAAAKTSAARRERVAIVGERWFNWGAPSLLAEYEALRQAGAQAIGFVTNEAEGALLIRELASLPPEDRLPVLAHHGIVGGDLVRLAGRALRDVDLSIVQFFAFAASTRPQARRLLEAVQRRFQLERPEDVLSAAGTAAAYDLTHLLALAVDRAGTTDRASVRRALEQVRGYEGAVKSLPRAFGPGRHEALVASDVFMARFDGRGRLLRAP